MQFGVLSRPVRAVPPVRSRRLRWARGAAGVCALLAVLLGLGALGWVGVQSGRLPLNHPSAAEFPVRGIDVSNHQGSVDWERVRDDGYSFTYLKATEGGDWIDPLYRELSDGARRAGLAVGAYHYFTFCRAGADQGRNFAAVVRGQDGGGQGAGGQGAGGQGAGGQAATPGGPPDLPPVVDLEFGGNCSHVPSVEEIDREFTAFTAVLRERGLPRPVLYVTSSFAEKYLTGAAGRGSPLATHRLWIRDLYGEPDGGCGRWAFWQFANRGQVDGVTGPVDLNVYCGDRTAFAEEFGAATGA